jgi:hypothetical protein
MAYTFKARCIKNDQSSNGSHVATLMGATGETATVPSQDMLCQVGEEYSVTVDGKFVPKPKPVAPEKYTGAERRVHALAIPSGVERRHAASTAKYTGKERRLEKIPVANERRHIAFTYPAPVAHSAA